MLSFAHFPIYTLDENAGEVILPGADQLATLGGNMDLRAQVANTTVSSYSWNTSGLTDATSISGSSTYDLTFQWDSSVTTATTNSVTLTVTNSSSQTQVQTYTFQVPAGTGTAGTGTTTWPQSLSPDTVSASAPSVAAHNVSVDSNSGTLDTAITLPTYNPNVPAVVLSYDSGTADPQPIIVGHHPLDPTLATPTQVSAQLTFNGTAASTYYYDTSQLTPGDVQQVALQASTSPSTGRYAYSIAYGDIRGTTTTSTVTGSATVINDSGSALGGGWSVDGLETIIPATGGVILDLGSGGKSLWFATGSGSTYVDPAGEFSTLVANMGGTYTRTLTNGEVLQFNSSGKEIADTDTDGVAITYGYDGSGRLSTIQDHYGNLTTFTYDGTTGLLDEITDPAGRIATFTHSGTALLSAELPDTSSWGYAYNGSGQLTQVTDPDSKVVTVTYDSADRVGTISNPDSTSETFLASQEQGFVPSGSGTSGSPAAATLLATATSTLIDPLGNETDLYPDWQGLGLTNVSSDPLGDIATADRDGNGLATISIDPLNRTTQYVYDSKGNVTESIDPALDTSHYTYNGFAEVTSYTDPNDNTTTYTYDSDGNNTVIQDALHNLTTMTYTATGQVATSEDANLHTTSYVYDSQDRLTTVTNPDSSTTLYGYNSAGDETSTTDARGFVTTMSYDPMNRLTGTTDALGDKVTYTYDPAGNLTVDHEPLSRTTSYSYDAMDRVVTVTDPLSLVTTYGYDADGDQTTVKDPLGRITTTTYDALNRPVTVTDHLLGTTTTVYDADGEKIETIDPLSRTTTWTYTVRGEVATITDPLGNVTTSVYDPDGNLATDSQSIVEGDATTSYTYDADERVIAVSDHLSRTTTTVYDAAGNTIATVDGAGDRTTYTYNSMNEVIAETDPLGKITTFTYDADGDQTTVKDPLGNITTTAYDALDRVTTITQAVGGSTTYAYDAAGRQVGLTDPVGNRTTWSYDADDRITAEANPLGTTTYSYDSDGEETATTDADGRQTTYSYNANGDQTGETWVGSSPSEIITYTYDADDELTGAHDAFSLLTYTYDADGEQLTAATSSSGGQPAVTLSSTYDALGNRLSLSDNLSSGGLISFGYDSMNEMTSISATYDSPDILLVAFGYDDAGRMTSIERSISNGGISDGFPVGGGGGGGTAEIDTELDYDADSRVTTIIHDVLDGSVLETYTYAYNNASELTSETNHEGTLSYTYDAGSELTGVSGASTATYTYDDNGNRTMTGYSTGSDNELTAGAGYTYTYDADGNLISETQSSTGDVTTYTYDYRNRLTNVVEENSSHTVILRATYTYDAMNRRIGTDETVSGTETKTWTVYDGVNAYADFDGSGTLLNRYLYGPEANQILARISASGTEAWYLADNEGTIRDIVDTTGTVIDHIAYDAYGNLTSESSASNGDRFKFDGMAWDAAIGLYYDNARYYDPASAQFISQDPLGLTKKSINTYEFSYNDPTGFIDPTGLQGITPPPVTIAPNERITITTEYIVIGNGPDFTKPPQTGILPNGGTYYPGTHPKYPGRAVVVVPTPAPPTKTPVTQSPPPTPPTQTTNQPPPTGTAPKVGTTLEPTGVIPGTNGNPSITVNKGGILTAPNFPPGGIRIVNNPNDPPDLGPHPVPDPIPPMFGPGAGPNGDGLNQEQQNAYNNYLAAGFSEQAAYYFATHPDDAPFN
jgi:RHS repeat-associated protein